MAQMAHNLRPDRSVGELFSELARELGTLFRQEVALAKVELSQQASRAGRNAGYLAVGGAIAYAAFLILAAAAVLALATVMPAWVAALLVGFVVGAVGAVMIAKALTALRSTSLAPRLTVQTLKEDVQWAKNQIR